MVTNMLAHNPLYRFNFGRPLFFLNIAITVMAVGGTGLLYMFAPTAVRGGGRADVTTASGLALYFVGTPILCLAVWILRARFSVASRRINLGLLGTWVLVALSALFVTTSIR
jgi:hypothetical protein